MKPAILFIALLAGAFALPWLTAQVMRLGWRRWRLVPSRSGQSGAAFAAILLRRANVKRVGVVEKGRLFHESYDLFAGDICLSQPVYQGRNLAALANATIQVGHVLQHAENDKSFMRLVRWNRILRVIVNTLPLAGAFILISPGKIRFIPALIIFFFLIAIVQVLTFPVVRDAAERGRKLIKEHQLLAPEEMNNFSAALKAATQRHLAAPMLDCFWLSWLT